MTKYTIYPIITPDYNFGELPIGIVRIREDIADILEGSKPGEFKLKLIFTQDGNAVDCIGEPQFAKEVLFCAIPYRENRDAKD